MKTTDVPQDNGIIEEYGHEICYAVDPDGNYQLTPSLGWEAKNIVNDQAWQVITAETLDAYSRVKNGTSSPLAFYQVKHHMDLPLLAQYVSMAKWRVRRHMKPHIFQKLPDKILQKYAEVFGISIRELQQLPQSFSHTQIRQR